MAEKSERRVPYVSLAELKAIDDAMLTAATMHDIEIKLLKHPANKKTHRPTSNDSQNLAALERQIVDMGLEDDK